MQKNFKCQQCEHRFVAEDEISTKCPVCGSNLLQPINPRKVRPWMYALVFIVFLAIGFGVSELVQPKLFANIVVEECDEPQATAEEESLIDSTAVTSNTGTATNSNSSTDTATNSNSSTGTATNSNSSTGSASNTGITTTATPKLGLSIAEAQSIIASGKNSSKIPDNTNIVVNDTVIDWQAFRQGVKLNCYSNIKVVSVNTDGSIVVKAN